ncbi:MAG: hypothetical protein Q4E62_09815 [Sutterellaceae bacterium]|nr:hypothetical protein [Sutterellaceae bacterium]
MITQSDIKTIFLAVVQFLVAALFCCATFGLYIYSAQHTIAAETWIEVGQETLLAASALLFLICAPRFKAIEGGLWLIGGFFVTLLIRELDAWSDMLFHGCWKYMAAIWLCALTAIIYKRNAGKSVVPGLVHFIRHRAWYVMLFGVVLLLVYSRLYGMKCLWELYAADQCAGWRNIKSFSEEAAELLAYMLIFWASSIYVFDLLRKKSQALAR